MSRNPFVRHREGPVTSSERRRSAIGGGVGAVLLALVVGVFHLVDGSRTFDGSDLVVFLVGAAVLVVVGYAFPRFTTNPSLAQFADAGHETTGWGGRLAVVLVMLVVLVAAAARFYY